MTNRQLFPSLIAFTVAALAAMGLLRWLEVPAGDFIDWLTAIGGFWLLIFVTTVPWNTHFRAREVLSDAVRAQAKDLKVKKEDLDYVNKIARTYLAVALSMHLVSAVALYLVALFEVSAVGYWGAILALLLTGLRPAARLYAYVQYRLSSISQEVRYPEQDVFELMSKLEKATERVDELWNLLHPEHLGSWTQEKGRELAQLEESFFKLREKMENFQLEQGRNLELIRDENRKQIAQISEDAKLLSQVRELVRFIKTA